MRLWVKDEGGRHKSSKLKAESSKAQELIDFIAWEMRSGIGRGFRRWVHGHSNRFSAFGIRCSPDGSWCLAHCQTAGVEGGRLTRLGAGSMAQIVGDTLGVGWKHESSKLKAESSKSKDLIDFIALGNKGLDRKRFSTSSARTY